MHNCCSTSKKSSYSSRHFLNHVGENRCIIQHRLFGAYTSEIILIAHVDEARLCARYRRRHQFGLHQPAVELREQYAIVHRILYLIGCLYYL